MIDIGQSAGNVKNRVVDARSEENMPRFSRGYHEVFTPC
jgi:hypothetical protein